MSTLGERLRLARGKVGLKQTQVKERTNINNKTLSGYENDVSEPDTATLSVLAELYGVSHKWLLTGEGSMKSKSNEQLTYKEEQDILKDLQNIIDGVEGSFSNYDGQIPEDLEDRELLISSLKTSMQIAKKFAKQKFTPNKYKENDE